MADPPAPQPPRSAYPSPFGRGWIPGERDIGLPDETKAARSVAPLPLAGGGW